MYFISALPNCISSLDLPLLFISCFHSFVIYPFLFHLLNYFMRDLCQKFFVWYSGLSVSDVLTWPLPFSISPNISSSISAYLSVVWSSSIFSFSYWSLSSLVCKCVWIQFLTYFSIPFFSNVKRFLYVFCACFLLYVIVTPNDFLVVFVWPFIMYFIFIFFFFTSSLIWLNSYLLMFVLVEYESPLVCKGVWIKFFPKF